MSDDDKDNPNIIDLSKVREERETLDDFLTGSQDEECFEDNYLIEDPIARFNRNFMVDILSRYRHSMRRMESLQLAMLSLILIQIVLTAIMLFALPY